MCSADAHVTNAQLPVEQHREELKESQVGHRVRYLSKHPKEMLDNKKRCDELMSMCGLFSSARDTCFF
jgi:hypothetical protein